MWARYLSSYPITLLKEINIFDEKNKNLRRYFLFFFLVAICANASIMTCRYPYRDDYCRYLLNYSCGLNCRYGTWLLEIFSYFSYVITDAAPFTQIVSCAILSYVAIICMKILGADISAGCTDSNGINYVVLLCFIPVIVNPYMLEVMFFRFDNVHMNLALLGAVLSAYFSSKNDSRCFIFQTIFLFYSLLFYQAAISAYFIFFSIGMLREVSSGRSLKDTIVTMKYWFYAMMVTALIYWPLVQHVKYAKKNGKLFIVPYGKENLNSIMENIFQYLSELRVDWEHHVSWKFMIVLIVTAAISFMRESFVNKKTRLSSIILISALFFCLLMSPYGINILLNYAFYKMDGDIPPRILYCFGIFVTFILFKNYLSIENLRRNKWIRDIYAVFLFFFGVWSIIISNSASNIIHMQNVLQHKIFYDLGKDMDEILENNSKRNLCVQFDGFVLTPTAEFFLEEYPVFRKIMAETWPTPSYFLMGFYSRRVADKISKIKFKITKQNDVRTALSSKKLLKFHQWYDIHMVDEKIIKVSFKNAKKTCQQADLMKIFNL